MLVTNKLQLSALVNAKYFTIVGYEGMACCYFERSAASPKSKMSIPLFFVHCLLLSEMSFLQTILKERISLAYVGNATCSAR